MPFFLAACKQAASALGGSCKIECCEGDLCNQASPGKVNTTAGNSTKPEVTDGFNLTFM